MRAALEATIWIKSSQSLLFAVVRLLKNLFLNLERNMMSQSLRVRNWALLGHELDELEVVLHAP
jgi:hypothetical protein